MKKILTFIILGFLTTSTFSFESDIMDWSTITLYCENIEEAGLVSCHVQIEENEWKKFIITAFGKPHELSKEQLNKLYGFPLNSLRITHGPFLEQFGGYGVYFTFIRYSYDKEKKKSVTEKISVIVRKGGIEIFGPLSNHQSIRIPVKE